MLLRIAAFAALAVAPCLTASAQSPDGVRAHDTTSITLDWLGFGTSVLAPAIGEAGRLLHLVLTAPRFEESQVLAERDLLVEETTQVTDDMFRYPFQLAFGAAFGDQGYGVPSLDTPEELPNLTPEQVRAWHGRALLAPRGVVVAVGDLDPEAALGLLAGVFDDGATRVSASIHAASKDSPLQVHDIDPNSSWLV